MIRCHHRRSIWGYCSCLGPPRTFEEACQAFQEKDLPFPRFDRINQEERYAVNGELYYHWHFPEPWHGSNPEWRNLNEVLRREIRKIRYPSPPSNRSEEATFDDDWEHIAPAGGASQPAAASGRADRTRDHPSYMEPHYASGPESSDGAATPPPPYSSHVYPGTRRARRNGEVPETARQPGGRNTGGFREDHGNSRHQGGLREDHGSSRHRGGHNAAYSREGSWGGGTPRDRDAGASPFAHERQYMTEHMDRVRIPEDRRIVSIRAHDTVPQNQMHQQSLPLRSGHRGRR